jgi:16S rRNA (cytosine967-C5)-methyltransferase
MTEDRESAYGLLLGLRRRRRGGAPGGRSPSPPALTPLASELGYGVIRHRSRLDWVIGHASRRLEGQIEPAVLDILRLGAYQLIFMPSIPRYAAVSESVELAKSRVPKAGGFVNWVLRRLGPQYRDLPAPVDFPDRTRWMATYHSFPLWMVKRWVGRFGSRETELFLAAMNTFPPLDLRINALRAGIGEVAEELAREGASVETGRYSPTCLRLTGLRALTDQPAFREGRIYIQDEASQLASHALGARRGEKILDACSGVGGKATHLAEITGNGARLTAIDGDHFQLVRLEENRARLGITSLEAVQGDLLDAPFPPEASFDRILVDAPCSSLGIIRRHPEFKWTKRPSDPKRFADRQQALLRGAADLVAPGGVVAYSTCTTEPEENEGVIEGFLDHYPHFAVLRPEEGSIGHLDELLTPEGFISTLPHRHGTNGGFVALLRRKPGSR